MVRVGRTYLRRGTLIQRAKVIDLKGDQVCYLFGSWRVWVTLAWFNQHFKEC